MIKVSIGIILLLGLYFGNIYVTKVNNIISKVESITTRVNSLMSEIDNLRGTIKKLDKLKDIKIEPLKAPELPDIKGFFNEKVK